VAEKLAVTLARIEERVNACIADVKEVKDDCKEIKKETKATNGRVTKLEQSRSFLKGSWAAIVAVASCVVGVIELIKFLF